MVLKDLCSKEEALVAVLVVWLFGVEELRPALT